MSNSIRNYDRVRLITDRFASGGASAGSVGYVIEVRSPDAFEVEFSGPDGTTYATVVASQCDIESFPEDKA